MVGNLQGGDEMVHDLVAEQCCGTVSRVHFGEETGRHTNWWRNSAAERRRRDGTRPGSRTASQKGQQGGVQGGDETAHDLVAEQHHGRVSRVEFEEEMRRRTLGWQNSTTEGSAGWSSWRRRDSTHPGGGTAPWNSQQW